MWEIAVVLLTLSPCVYLWESGLHLCSFTPNHSLVWKSGKMERQMEHIKSIYICPHTHIANACQNDSGHSPCTWISFVKLRVNRFLHDFLIPLKLPFCGHASELGRQVASNFSCYTFKDRPHKISDSQGMWKKATVHNIVMMRNTVYLYTVYIIVLRSYGSNISHSLLSLVCIF